MDMHVRAVLRRDALDWNIAGAGNVDVLCELTWSGLQSRAIEAGWDLELPSRFVGLGRASFGRIHAGRNQDSDFSAPGRTEEFSRSNNDASSGATLEASIALGRRLASRVAGPRGGTDLRWTPLIGLAYQRQNLIINDGWQTIPAAGPFDGLSSHYDAEWFGPWLGLQLEFKPHPRWSVRAVGEYHVVAYRGVANWNLRSDLAHPVSFRHRADGDGLELSASVTWQMTRRWTLELTGRALDYRTFPGRDTAYLSSGARASTTLNAVNWTSQQILLGATYDF